MEKHLEQLAVNLKLAFELHDAGVQIMRLRLKRRFAYASATDHQMMLTAWLRGCPAHELSPHDNADRAPVIE